MVKVGKGMSYKLLFVSETCYRYEFIMICTQYMQNLTIKTNLKYIFFNDKKFE